MRKSLWITLVAVAILTGCSTTDFFTASGSYAIDSAGTPVHFSTVEACANSGADNCQRYDFSWRSERFCGLYAGREDREANLTLGLAGKVYRVIDWDTERDSPVFLGDDEDFELASDEANDDGFDLECGVFDPPVNLTQVEDGDSIHLRMQCVAIARGIDVMPPSDDPYPLLARRTDSKKVLFGCRR